MKTQKLAALLLTLALSFGASQGALAHDDDSCVSAVTDIGFAIDGAYFRNDRDQDRLGHKVDAALSKLDRHRVMDALQKVGDIREKVTALRDARKQKIDYADANTILGEVYNAEVCLAALL